MKYIKYKKKIIMKVYITKIIQENIKLLLINFFQIKNKILILANFIKDLKILRYEKNNKQ